MANSEHLERLLRSVNDWNRWHGAYLSTADLSGANLRGANLSGANLNWNSHDLIAELLRREAGGGSCAALIGRPGARVT